MKIAVTGADGQLGSELCKQLGSDAEPLNRSALDVTRPEEVNRVLSSLKPAAVINSAAYTQVDMAEKASDEANATNALAPGYLAKTCEQLDCPLLHISTDYVFGGDVHRRTPYTESDAPNPVNAYGRTKLAGEDAVRNWNKHFIVRTCGLYADVDSDRSPRNFVEKMLKLAEDHPTLKVVGDQICTPSYVPDIAAATILLARSASYGTYHVTNRGEASWFEFAGEIFRLLTLPVKLQEISTEQFIESRTPDLVAPRPRYSVLSTARYQQQTGKTLRDWRVALADCLQNAQP